MKAKDLLYTEKDAKELLLELYKTSMLIDNPPDLGLQLSFYIKDESLKKKYFIIENGKENPTFKLNTILDILGQKNYIIFINYGGDGKTYGPTTFRGFTPNGHDYVEYLIMPKYKQLLSKLSADYKLNLTGLVFTYMLGIISKNPFVLLSAFIKNLF